MAEPAAPSTTINAAAAEVQRSLARDFNLLQDASNRTSRKNAIKKIADALAPTISKAKGKSSISAAPVKPKLIFSAKAAAAAAAAPAPEAAPAPAAATSAAPLTAEQKDAIATLNALLLLPGASGAHTLLALLVQRIADEMENVRAQTLQLSSESVFHTSLAQPSRPLTADVTIHSRVKRSLLC